MPEVKTTMQTHTIEVAVPDDLLECIDQRAQTRGSDRSQVIQEIIAREFREEKPHAGMTFAQILAPVHEYTRQQGYTQEEIADFVDAEIKAHRAEKRAKAAQGETQDG